MKLLAMSFMLAITTSGVMERLEAQSSALSVCQVINSAADRQEVTVRGELAGSKRHGIFLSEGIQLNPCPASPIATSTVPSIIPLAFSPFEEIEFTAAQEALIRDFYKALPSAAGSQHLKLIVKGIIVRRPFLPIFRAADGTYTGPGMNSDQGYFITLVMKSIAIQNAK